MKILPKIYKSVTDEPFRVENYNGKRVEFHRLENTPYLVKYAAKGRFAVWTSDGENYRVLVESGYYEECSELYQNSINNIWLDYTHFVYDTQRKIGKKYNLISLGVTALILVVVLLISLLGIVDDSAAFIIGMVLLFVVVFFVSSNQQRKVTSEIQESNRTATKKIKKILGDRNFENLLQKQSNYYYKYMEIDVPTAAEEALLKEDNDSIETTAEVVENKEESSNE